MKTEHALYWGAGALGLGAAIYWLMKKPSDADTLASAQLASEKQMQDAGPQVISVTYKPSEITKIQQVDPVIERVGRGWNLGALAYKGADFEYQIFWLPYNAQKTKPSAAQWRASIAAAMGVAPAIVDASGK